MDFKKWYKSVVESSQPEPDKRVWEEIESELDLDIVWDRIENKIHKKNRSSRVLYPYIAAASLLLITALGILLRITITGKEPARYLTTIENLHEIRSESPELNIYRHTAPAITGVSRQSSHELILHEEPEADKNEFYIESLPELKRDYNKVRTVVTSKEPEDNLIAVMITPQAPEKRWHGKEPPRFYAGITGHISNTWLLNNKTIDGLRRDNLTASLPSFGYNLGLHAGWYLTEKFGFHTELYIFSLSRQDYNEYFNGLYVNTRMSFNYTGLTLLGKYSLTDNGQREKHALMLGGYTGIMNTALQSREGEKQSLTGEYYPLDYGVVAGYEYSIAAGQNLLFATGVQAKYGLHNIFRGSERVPGFLNNTRNASINITFSIRHAR